MSVNISEILVGMIGILSDSSKVKVDLKKAFSSSADSESEGVIKPSAFNSAVELRISDLIFCLHLIIVLDIAMTVGSDLFHNWPWIALIVP